MNGTRLTGERGFSLLETLIVIIIIGILAAIATPMYLGQRDRAHNADARQAGRTVALAVMDYWQEQGDDATPLQPGQANKAFLVAAGAIDATDWPRNAFDKSADMVLGAGSGDYYYVLISGPRRFRLTVHLRNAPDFTVP